MNRDDDQQLWDLLGKAPAPRLSAFFSRNVLRQARQEPELLRVTSRWLNWKVLAPASATAVAVVVGAAMLLRTDPPVADVPAESKVVATAPVSKAALPETKADASSQAKPPVEEANPSIGDLGALATIDEQDYDTVANLDDLLVLYESTLWDENTSL